MTHILVYYKNNALRLNQIFIYSTSQKKYIKANTTTISFLKFEIDTSVCQNLFSITVLTTLVYTQHI